MLCCPPLSVLYFTGLLPWPTQRWKDRNSVMYKVFLGDSLPRELGVLLHRTGKVSAVSQISVPLCRKNCLWIQKEGKEVEGRGRPRETEKKYIQEKLLCQNYEGRSLQRYMSLSLRSKTSLCKCRSQQTLCYQNARRTSVVWDQYHLQIYTPLFLLPIPTAHTRECPGPHCTLLLKRCYPISAAGRTQKSLARVFQVFVEVRETGGGNNFSHMGFFSILNNWRKCYYEYNIIQTHPLTDFTLAG